MDNSGKSQLTEALSTRYSLDVIKRSGPPESPESFKLDTLSFLVLDPVAIFDRHPVISEGIYGPILRNYNVFEDSHTKWVWYLDRLIKNEPLLIYCRPPEEKILCFSATRKQMDGVIKNARLLISRYDRLIDKLEHEGMMVVHYDFTSLVAMLPVETAVEMYLKRRGEEL